MADYRQFKLSNGDEIICEVIEYPEENDDELIIRKALLMRAIDDDEQGIRYYNFRPWVTMQEGSDNFVSLNYGHVIAEAIPSEKILKHFLEAVEAADISEEDIQNKIDSYINKLRQKLEEVSETDSDEPSNVITFKPSWKDKLH